MNNYLTDAMEEEILDLMGYSNKRRYCVNCIYYLETTDNNLPSCNLNKLFRVKIDPSGKCNHYSNKELMKDAKEIRRSKGNDT